MKRTLKKGWIFVAMASISLASCSLDPKITENVDYTKNPISTENELDASLIGAYSLMTSAKYYGNNILSFSEVRSGNAYSTNRTNRLGSLSTFTLAPTHKYTVETWEQIYLVVSEANRAIESNLNDSKAVQSLKGQAYVLRALAHYDLLRLYGQQYVDNKGLDGLGVPYIKKYADVTAKVTRGTVGSNREDIFADLDKGIELLTESDSGSKVKISLAAALGLKARIALFFSNWSPDDLGVARDNAQKAIEVAGTEVMTRSAFLDTYKADDPQSNSIFELKQSGVDNSGSDSMYYLYESPVNGGYGDIVLNFKVEELFENDAPKDVLDEDDNVIETIPANDIRADREMIYTIAGDLRNKGKYPKMTSNLKLMRYEELLLIFVEADYRINNSVTADALKLFNNLKRNRLVDFTDLTTYDLEDIRLERQKELLFEGFGFEDLMRFHLEVVNPRLRDGSQIKPIPYGDKRLVFPIPQSEINASGIPQN